MCFDCEINSGICQKRAQVLLKYNLSHVLAYVYGIFAEEKEKQQPRSDFFEEMKNNHIFKGILTKTNVLVSSRIRIWNIQRRENRRTYSHVISLVVCAWGCCLFLLQGFPEPVS